MFDRPTDRWQSLTANELLFAFVFQIGAEFTQLQTQGDALVASVALFVLGRAQSRLQHCQFAFLSFGFVVLVEELLIFAVFTFQFFIARTGGADVRIL